MGDSQTDTTTKLGAPRAPGFAGNPVVGGAQEAAGNAPPPSKLCSTDALQPRRGCGLCRCGCCAWTTTHDLPVRRRRVRGSSVASTPGTGESDAGLVEPRLMAGTSGPSSAALDGGCCTNRVHEPVRQSVVGQQPSVRGVRRRCWAGATSEGRCERLRPTVASTTCFGYLRDSLDDQERSSDSARRYRNARVARAGAVLSALSDACERNLSRASDGPRALAHVVRSTFRRLTLDRGCRAGR
jgi:hypothetical protein